MGRELVVLVCFFSALILSCSACSNERQPFEDSLEIAVSALEDASIAGAPEYARSQYLFAQELLRRGRLEVASQRGRFQLLRNFEVADSLFGLARTSAKMAAEEARENLSRVRSRSESEYRILHEEYSHWHEALESSLGLSKAYRYLSSAELALEMSDLLIKEGEYNEAFRVIARGRSAMVKLAGIIEELDNDNAQKAGTWSSWVKETLEVSRVNKSSVIIVNKSAHRLYLVKAGRLVHTFNCELGYNSARQKYFAGDGATPEGKYNITAVRKKGSKYYKALPISFPSAHDRKRFAENKARGIISRKALIGAFIEIHGAGGENRDWTDGCIALRNQDIDTLWKYVKVGTPVTIVRQSDEWP